MALDLGNSFFHEPFPNKLESENLEFKSTQGSAVPRRVISEFSSTELNTFQYTDKSWARRKYKVYKFFPSWLQREKHSKDAITSQLTMEQFMLSDLARDKTMLKKKQKSSYKNLEKFVEDLTDGCMKPPVLVYVCLQGQEALFSEDTSWKEVIVNF